MPRKKGKTIDDNFIMSPKYDFVFKYIFGNEKHKDLLIALLSDILAVPEEEFEGIEIINSELLKEFRHMKKIIGQRCDVYFVSEKEVKSAHSGLLVDFADAV